MKLVHVTLILVLIATALAGCGGDTAASTGEQGGSAQTEGGSSEGLTSTILSTAYENALPASSQLALGIFFLEETGNAVTPEQAKALLPLWQAIQGGTLKNEAETNAVLKQIEEAMTSEQLTAIAAMRLTFDDMGTWAQEQGVTLGASGDGAGGFALPEGVTEEQMEAMRATRKAGGEGGFAPPEGMSQEEREAMRATAEANGMTRPGGVGGMGAGQLAALAGPLVELLTRVAAG